MHSKITPGQRICFSGKMHRSHDDMAAMAGAAGMRTTRNAWRADVCVVCNADVGSQVLTRKQKIAKGKGILIISEADFLAHIDRNAGVGGNDDAPVASASSNDLLAAWRPGEAAHPMQF